MRVLVFLLLCLSSMVAIAFDVSDAAESLMTVAQNHSHLFFVLIPVVLFLFFAWKILTLGAFLVSCIPAIVLLLSLDWAIATLFVEDGVSLLDLAAQKMGEFIK